VWEFGALKVGGQILGQTSGIPSSIIEIMEGFVMPYILTIVFTISRKRFNVPIKLGTPNIKEH
jgi:hypothetical protein